MAKCASLTQIFETPLSPLSPNPTLIESLSWRHQIKSIPPDIPSFTELFGELHFNDPSLLQHQNSNQHEDHDEDEDKIQVDDDNNDEDAAAAADDDDDDDDDDDTVNVNVNTEESEIENNAIHQSPEVSSFTEIYGELCSKEPSQLPFSHPQVHLHQEDNENNSDNANDGNNNKLGRTTSGVSDVESTSSSSGVNLQLCTEGLGFESFDVDGTESVDYPEDIVEQVGVRRQTSLGVYGKLRHAKSYPPPISSIGMNGKPWVYFRSFRNDGRFILRQFSVPTQVFFNAYREDGSLRLHPVRPVRQSTRTKEGEVKGEQTNTDVQELGDGAERE